jgi:penicillin-binding protein 1C
MWQRIKHWAVKRKLRLSIIAVLLVLYYFILPKKLFTAPTSFVIEDSKGELMNAAIATDGQWRFPADKLVPDKFAKCIVAYEDKRFYYHWGLDPVAMSRAIKQNLTGGKVVSGASTITMYYHYAGDPFIPQQTPYFLAETGRDRSCHPS